MIRGCLVRVCHFLASVFGITRLGMGEPLNNFDEVLTAVRFMTDANRFNLAQGRVTVSTVGTLDCHRRVFVPSAATAMIAWLSTFRSINLAFHSCTMMSRW